MATLNEIVVALGAAIADIGGIQSKGYMLANPTPPYAQVLVGGDAGDLEYDHAMGGGLDWCPCTVQVFSGAPTDQTAQIKLLEYIDPTGPRSVKAALEADKTLGGLVQDLRVTRCTGYRQYAAPEKPPMLGATFYVDVLISEE